MLALSSLEKTLSILKRDILRAEANVNDEELRNATIQQFEYSFYLCWKMLKRQIEADAPHPSAVDATSFRELMREGFERGYISDPEDWFLSRENRNTFAHVYDESKATIVCQSALKFEAIAQYLPSKPKAQTHD